MSNGYGTPSIDALGFGGEEGCIPRFVCTAMQPEEAECRFLELHKSPH
jgi:hypothetical protein